MDSAGYARRIKWLYFTVAVGLLPFLCRIILFLFRRDLSYDYILNEIDIVAFSLALQVGIINELIDNFVGSEAKKYQNFGTSFIFLLACAFVLILSYTADIDKSDKYNHTSIRICSGILALASLFFSYKICGVLQSDETNVQ